jgi:large subunit ribosomal protein L25
MEKIKLEERKLTGKKIKQLRKKGLVPGVIYNSKGESINISIDKGTAVHLYKTATPTTILDVEINGEEKKAIVKDVDINPRTAQILHIAFFEITPKKEMDFTIPFTLKGIAPAVKNSIGILVQISDTVQVRCKLKDLVSEIEVDVTGLEHPGQTISLEDIDLPKGLELVHKEDADLPIATITQPQKLEVLEEVKPEEEIEELEEGGEGEEDEEKKEEEESEVSEEQPTQEEIADE